MKIEKIELSNFKSFSNTEIVLNGKNTILFGINGTGKSSVLRSINLLFSYIINQLVGNEKQLRQSLNISEEDIKVGKSSCTMAVDLCIGNSGEFHFSRSMERKSKKRTHKKIQIEQIANALEMKYKGNSIPIYAHYGTNRLVLDVPLRIRTRHDFNILSAYEKAIENRIDFRTFFEWFCNQEDYQNQRKVELQDLSYEDKALQCTKEAVQAMLVGCSRLRVDRKPKLAMKVDKGGISLNVTQLSDGEKCTLALFGDLARRLAIANPNLENPLEGDGIVLIDEIELHMHPTWQRNVLKKLNQTFPNIQFIIATHSPLVLSELDDDYNILLLESKENTILIDKISRLDGYDANYILEEFMGTKSRNEETENLISAIYKDISSKKYDSAQEKIDKLEKRTNSNQSDVITAKLMIKKGRAKFD